MSKMVVFESFSFEHHCVITESWTVITFSDISAVNLMLKDFL